MFPVKTGYNICNAYFPPTYEIGLSIIYNLEVYTGEINREENYFVTCIETSFILAMLATISRKVTVTGTATMPFLH